ncbi:hypothetical protein DPEC_G00273290 [Dallia pectoralis]|uniref:Uncharacterized protein n=1 Tax=Dallia pectoralis TaxID=75939 RepID=A0ACC2FQ75_DALPE|nr:hypothetical protein DPEC_G00273290 [Dallia pectoralis]
MDEYSIDQNKMPGVKEVVRDFVVLEDHCLAHNLQEQEIESHLASNVTKSRLVQQDVALAKQLQQEEDRRAKAKAHRQQRDIERSDNEIAQEIQEELVRQAEQQRIQEEKDAAIARKLQEKERKEERKRQKQLEANFEEDYYEDKGAVRPPLDLDEKPRRPASRPYSPMSAPLNPGTRRGHSPEYGSPEYGSPARGARSRNMGNHGDRYPDDHPTQNRSSRNGGPRSKGPDYQEPRRHREERGEQGDRVVRRKEGPPRPPPPSYMPVERDQTLERERDQTLGRERDKTLEREREPRRDLEEMVSQSPSERSGERHHSRDKHRQQERSRELDLDKGREPFQTSQVEEEERQSKAHLRLHSVPNELWEEQARRSPGRERGERNTHRVPEEGPRTGRDRLHSHPAPREQGHIMQGGPGGRGPVLAGGEYGLGEVTQGITKLNLRDQELLDMEVARKLQEEEMKASKMDKRAAQVAQDEEIARLLMEQEKKEYKKSRDKEKQAMWPEDRRRPEEREMRPEDRRRPEERGRRQEERGMRPEERRRPEGGEYKPISEEVVRPRLREEEYQKSRNHQKPTRPPQPHSQIYQNVDTTYSYSESHYSSRAPARPEATDKGVYYRQ